MQTKTFATLFCLSALSSATAWSMQPGVRLAATAARQQLARSALKRTCMPSLKPVICQFPNGRTARNFSSSSTNASDTAALAFFFTPYVLCTVSIGIQIVRSSLEEEREYAKDLIEFANNPDPSGEDSVEIRQRERQRIWFRKIQDDQSCNLFS